MAGKTKRRRSARTAFVPRVVFTGACLGVIPACALASCGGDDSSESMDASVEADVHHADACWCEVADVAFARDTRPDMSLAVADAAFSDSADADAPNDGGADADGAG